MIKDFILKRVETLKKENGIISVALVGSYARNEENEFSDIDILCLKTRKKEPKIEIIDKKYFVISYLNKKVLEETFTSPIKASKNISGLKTAVILFDPKNYFLKVKKRAENFLWDEALLKKREKYVNEEFLGWMEEINKSLQGLILNDKGKMIMGLHGLTFGMFNIISIYKCLLIKSDNSFFPQVIQSMNKNVKFVKNSFLAFGIEKSNGITERIVAGFEVFFQTYFTAKEVLYQKNRDIIEHKILEIKNSIKTFNSHKQF
jgi:predicted nucleotidyltransferase